MAETETLKTLYAEVPIELHKRTRIQAIEEGRSLAAVVRDALERYLSETTKGAA